MYVYLILANTTTLTLLNFFGYFMLAGYMNIWLHVALISLGPNDDGVLCKRVPLVSLRIFYHMEFLFDVLIYFFFVLFECRRRLGGRFFLLLTTLWISWFSCNVVKC